nr:3 hydroxyacyl coenzyme A dehydratase 3 [Hymenolepis microstoma]
MSLISDSGLHPSLQWSQDENKVYIAVKLSDVENPTLQIGNNSISFRTTGIGANGLGEYTFALDLFSSVDGETSNFTVSDTSVNVVLVKRETGVWPRLTESATQRLPWLRTDFDRLSAPVLKAMLAAGGNADDDADESSDGEWKPHTSVNFIRPSPEEIRERQMRRAEEMAREQYEEFFRLLTNPLVLYLLIFNIFQWAGFIYVFGTLVHGWWIEGNDIKSKAFDLVADRLIILQLAAFLEIAHVLLKWVKGRVLPTIIQVLGRNLVLFIVLLPHKELQEYSVVFNLFLAWSAIELVRYPYYALRLFDEEIGLITYLRYTLWIPLYPIGFICEGKLIILSIPILQESRRFCIEMPNIANVAFDLPSFLHVYILLMLPAFFIQMQRMYLQRRRKFMPGLAAKLARRRQALKQTKRQALH